MLPDTQAIKQARIPQRTWYKDFRFFYMVLCCLGFLWLGYHASYESSTEANIIPTCLIKKTTGVSCPSCGTTRSILGFVKGDLVVFYKNNPLFALAVMACMLIGPVLIFRDWIFTKNTFNQTYKRVIQIIEKPYVRNLLIAVVLFNWLRLILNGI